MEGASGGASAPCGSIHPSLKIIVQHSASEQTLVSLCIWYPPRGETRGGHRARSPPHQRGNRASRGLWAGSKQASSAKIGNPRAGVEDSAFSLPANRALPRRRLPHQDNQQERQEASCV